jgi:lysozyme
MKLHPRVTRSVVELVKRFEGLRRRAARLPDGGWTIGYGHTRSAREGAVVSPEDAEALLYYDLTEVAEKVEAWTFTPLNQNQFEALTALAFNIGLENFRRSTVLKRVNEGQHLQAAASFELWRKSDFGGEDLVVDALVRRRAAEKAHYLTPPEGFKPSPTPVLRPSFDHSVIEAAANAHANRYATVVDAPLDGETAEATVEQRADAVDSRAAHAPFVTTAGATARLHQLFPDKPESPQAAAPSDIETPPFALETERQADETVTNTPPLKVVNDGPFDRVVSPQPAELERAGPPVAFQSSQITSFTSSFSGFADPPPRQIEPSAPFQNIAPPLWTAVEPPPLVLEQQPVFEPEPTAKAGDGAPLFDTPSQRTSFAIPEVVRTMRLREDGPMVAEDRGLDEGVADFGDAVPSRLHNRSFIYSAVGLLGVALFAAALFSMFSGKANPVNLVIGLMGILLMTPAGGYFLLNVLNRRDAVPQI